MNELFAAVSGQGMFQALLWLVGACCVWLLLDWGRKQIAPPEPMNKIVLIIIVLIVLYMCFNAIRLMLGLSILWF